MKNLTFTLLILSVLFTSNAAIAQKAYITGYSGLSVYSAGNIHSQDTICCGQMTYIAKQYDNNLLFVTHWMDNRMYYIDSMDKIVDSMSIRIWDLVSDDSTNKIFASQTINNAVYIIDPVAKTYDSVTINEPNMLEKRPGKKEIWVANKSQFSVIDYSGTPSVTNYTFTVNNTFYRDDIRFTKDGNTAMLPDGYGGKTYKIDANTKTIIDSINIAGHVEFSNNDAKFYLSGGLKNKVYIYNTTTLALLDSIATTRGANGLYINPYTGNLWVVNHNENSLTIIDTTTNMVIDSTHTTTGPDYVVFNKPKPSSVGNIAQGTNDIVVYPNPANHTIFLNQEVENIVLHNVQGQVIRKADNTNKLDLTNVPAGTYLLNIYTHEVYTSKRITIK